LPAGYDHKYTYSHLGYNLKITDMQAACGLAQLERLPEFINARNNNYSYLKDKLKALSDHLDVAEATKNSTPSWFGFPITIKSEDPNLRVELIKFLDQRKIGTRLLFAGNLIRQPYFEYVQYRTASNLNNTDLTMNNTFWVGIYPGLNEQHLNYVAQTFYEFFE